MKLRKKSAKYADAEFEREVLELLIAINDASRSIADRFRFFERSQSTSGKPYLKNGFRRE